MSFIISPIPPIPFFSSFNHNCHYSSKNSIPSHGILSTRHTLRACAGASDPSLRAKPQLSDYDRNYYDQLKNDYADDPYVTIHSRDDYELDPTEAPSFYEHRGRNLDVIRENVRKRVEAYNREKAQAEINGQKIDEDDEDDDELPPDALRWTDFHTEEELASLSTRALTEDVSTGRMWSCPMTEEELEMSKKDDEYIDFRPSTEDAPNVFPMDDGVTVLPYYSNNPLASDVEEDALSELENSWYYMSTRNRESNFDSPRWGENLPIPDQDDYRRWQLEAEKRGGNAVVGSSHDLPPYADIPGDKEFVNGADMDVPRQHDILVNAYDGAWAGEIQIFSLNGTPATNEDNNLSSKTKNSQFQPVIERVLPVYTDISKVNGTMHVHTTVQLSVDDDEELMADTAFSSLTFANGLVRGRAVSSDASYICVPQGAADYAHGFSIPTKTLKRLLNSSNVMTSPVLEIGLVCASSKKDNENNSGKRRHRIFLFSDGEPLEISPLDVDNEQKDRKSAQKHKFTHAVVITESKCNNIDEAAATFSSPVESHSSSLETIDSTMSLPSVNLSDLTGSWTGNALLLQPEYPPEGMRLVETEFNLNVKETGSITQDDITEVEDKLELPPGDETKRKEKQKGKKKVSARVAAARAFDQSRLSECDLLCKEQVGDLYPEESHAWKSWSLPMQNADVEENNGKFSWMTSPRIGRFVDDYAALVLNKDIVLSFPLTNAFPGTWSIVSVVEMTKPKRRRIVAGRSREGILVGGLFTNETMNELKYEDKE